MDQQTPQEIIAKQLRSIQERGAAEEQHMVEGVDFYFEEDPELSKFSDNKKKKDRKRKHKAEPVSNEDIIDVFI